MAWLTIIVGAILVVAVVAWFVLARQHPEAASGHADDRRHIDASGRGTQSPGVMDRPAGPDAENMAGDPPGGFTAPGSTGARPQPGAEAAPQ